MRVGIAGSAAPPALAVSLAAGPPPARAVADGDERVLLGRTVVVPGDFNRLELLTE